MARINLLPWREAERKRRQRDFAVMTGAGLALTVLIGLGVHLQVEQMISAQEHRNEFLQTQIRELDHKIGEIKKLERTKANLLARMNVIQRLQQSRPEIVHLFDELVTAIPEGVYLTKADQSGRSVVVEGKAQSNARVSAFMRNIDASGWLTNPRLLLIEQKDKSGGLSRFQLKFDQKEQSTADNAQDKQGKGRGKGRRSAASWPAAGDGAAAGQPG